MSKKFKSFLQESIIDPVRDTLSPTIFQNVNNPEPVLQLPVLRFIYQKIEKLSKELNIDNYHLIGSILTKRWTDTSDIDINLLVNPEYKSIEEIREIAAKHSGQYIPNTLHPLNFHPIVSYKEYGHALDVADAIFDLKGNKFIVTEKPDSEKVFDISKYASAFKQTLKKLNLLTQDLDHELLDYDQLTLAPSQSIKDLEKLIQAELKELEASTNNLVDYYEKIKQDRRDAFAKKVTQKDIRDYGSKNRLPENIIYKLLERCNYMEFLNRIKEIIGYDGKLSKDEADELSKYVKTNEPKNCPKP